MSFSLDAKSNFILFKLVTYCSSQSGSVLSFQDDIAHLSTDLSSAQSDKEHTDEEWFSTTSGNKSHSRLF